MADGPGDVTLLLAEWKRGREDALAKLIPLVYRELRRVAGHFMRAERPNHTLQPTALVHETFVLLVNQKRADWQCRDQFIGVAARLMRRVLVDYARRRAARKRDGAAADCAVVESEAGAHTAQAEEILAVDEALARLGEQDPQLARVVELRYFSGLSVEEIAASLAISPRTVKRDWALAKGWLRVQLTREPLV